MSISEIVTSLGSVPLAAAAFLAAVGIVVFVHEAGHYLAARACGIDVLVFSVGFGRPVIQRKDRFGTTWQIGLIPIGGYVRFAESDQPGRIGGRRESSGGRQAVALDDAGLAQRALTVAAGPLANFLFAAAVFGALAAATGIIRDEVVIRSVKPAPGAPFGFAPGDRIMALDGIPISDYTALYAAAAEIGSDGAYTVQRQGNERIVHGPHPFPPLIERIIAASPAAVAGLRRGDLVLAVEGERIHSFGELARIVQASGERELLLTVWRDGRVLDIGLAGREEDVPNADGSFTRRVMIGIAGGAFFVPATKTPSMFEAVQIGVSQTAAIIYGTVNGLARMISRDISASNLQGPIGIARLTAGAAAQGPETFIRLIAFLSVAIGFVNLLPVPMLDGGHLAFHLYEAIAGRPPSGTFLRFATRAGMALLAALMVFVVFNDIGNLIASLG